ncbi:outer membrane beta-barrel protein [Maribellus maritimus]|uniref:outer membrane beta-barrel protein n=1 Tax=Maribellus maritimus TaxID=2870838 RepID=UPI001EEBB877|nr:outer membrane beta-barrel protein [Maribellus maritimus]MCG6190184.1 PorT family protein [Maribellus maritimus]
MKSLLLLVFLLSSITVSSQDLSIGINGGTLFSSIHKTETLEGITMYKDRHLTPTFGLTAELRLFNEFFGVLEVNYEEKGFAEHYFSSFSSVAPTPPESLFRVDNKSSFNYISFPILLRYKYGEKIKIYGSAGFSPSVLTDADELNSDVSLAYNTKKIDVSGIIEAGLELNLSSNIALNCGARYDRSVTHHNKHPRPIDGGELRHTTYRFYGGIKYYIK